MDKKPPIKRTVQKTLIISPKYTQNLLEIANYGYELFGAACDTDYAGFLDEIQNTGVEIV
ncbi:MAG: hypothetical protein FWD60_05340 [Candidatus Azobacteroides sp.]|nr:hypothetical protein [Candidatus Azobacteroides sp.]